MQGFNFVALRKLGVIADPWFRKYVCSFTVWNHCTWSKRCPIHYYCIGCCYVFVCL